MAEIQTKEHNRILTSLNSHQRADIKYPYRHRLLQTRIVTSHPYMMRFVPLVIDVILLKHLCIFLG